MSVDGVLRWKISFSILDHTSKLWACIGQLTLKLISNFPHNSQYVCVYNPKLKIVDKTHIHTLTLLSTHTHLIFTQIRSKLYTQLVGLWFLFRASSFDRRLCSNSLHLSDIIDWHLTFSYKLILITPMSTNFELILTETCPFSEA